MRNILLLVFAITFTVNLHGQKEEKESRFMLGINGGANISRVFYADTFPSQFSKRNRVGPMFGINGIYDINSSLSVAFSVNMVNKGYRINNDTMPNNPDIVRKFWSMNIPLGVHFRQQFNAQNFIMEKFGLIGNFNFRKDSTVVTNANSGSIYRLTEISQRNFYPMFYLGFAIGGVSENNNRYEFGLTYTQSLSKDAIMRVNHGQDLANSFPLNYRGGYLQIGFTYYFNLSNFRKSTDYFY